METIINRSAALLMLIAAIAITAPAQAASLSKGEEELFARQKRLANQLVTRANQIISSLEPKLAELRSRMKQELASQQTASEACPGHIHVELPVPPQAGACDEMERSLKPCVAKNFDIAQFQRQFDLRVNDFRMARQLVDNIARRWADNRSHLRSQIIEFRDDPGKSWYVSNAIAELDNISEENDFYFKIYSAVIWEIYLVWELEVGEARGFPFYDTTGANLPNSPNLGFPGLLALYRQGAAINVAPSYRSLAVASCHFEVADWNWTHSGTGTEAEVIAVGRAEQQQWRKCRNSEDQERDRVAPLVRQLRDRLIDQRADLRKIASDWRNFGISNHIYAGDGPAAVSAAYGNTNGEEVKLTGVAANFPAIPVGWTTGKEVGNSKETSVPPLKLVVAGAYPKEELRLPSECWDGTQLILLGGEPAWPAARIRYPDVETSPFELAFDLLKPINEEGAISGAADTERP